MTNNTSTRQRRRRASASTAKDPQIPLLKEIAQSLMSQQTSQIPERPDVAITAKPLRDRIYPITQAYVGPAITGSASVEVDGAIIFNLSSIPNSSNFAAVFDRYRIRQARVSFFPAVNFQNTGFNSMGPLYTVLDYDDGTLTPIANLVNYDNLKVAPVGAFFERTLTPRAALAAQSGALLTSVAQASAMQWFDTASPSVNYFGLKFAVPVQGTAFTLFTTVVTIDLEFAHPR